MDRTNEFAKIVVSTHIPQRQVSSASSPYTRVFEVDAMVRKALQELDRTLGKERIYESFTLQAKIDKVREQLQSMRGAMDAEMSYRNDQEAASYASLNGIIRNRVARHLLKLTEVVRRKDSRAQAVEERRQRFDSEPQETQDVVLMESEEITERVRERQRISMQISEIGQIMEEISVHVSLQEESFKRIDDLMGTSDALISGSLDLMKATWENVTGTRSAIAKFFLFWVVLVLLFWLFRR